MLVHARPRSLALALRDLLVSISASRLLPQLQSSYSTTTSAAADVAVPSTAASQHKKLGGGGGGSDFMVHYLVNSIGLSRDEAISASAKVSHLNSTQKPDLVINLFKRYGGLDETHIRQLVSSVPQILLHRPDETLEAKFRVFQDLGFSGSYLVRLINDYPPLFRRGLNTTILPVVNYLKEVLGGSNDKVVKAISASSRLLSSTNVLKLVPDNILLLQRDYGFSNEQIEKLLMSYPRILLRNPESLQDVLHRVEQDLGIPRGKKKFFWGVVTVHSTTRETMENKFGVFRSFGLSDSNILAVVSSVPSTLHASQSAIRLKLNFYLKELGHTPAYITSNPVLLTYSLEKRVKPRSEVLKILKENKLVKSSLSLLQVVFLTEVKFVNQFVQPYRDKIPKLHKTYTGNKKRLLNA